MSITGTSKIVKIVTTQENGVKIERGYNKLGKVIKESIFKDYNKDGTFSTDELYSVKYSDGSMTPDSQTYIDKDGDGYYDEIVKENPIFGKEVSTVSQQDKSNPFRQADLRMDTKYGNPDSDSPILLN